MEGNNSNELKCKLFEMINLRSAELCQEQNVETNVYINEKKY